MILRPRKTAGRREVSLPYTFRGGVHPRGEKRLTEQSAIDRSLSPATVYIPVSQHIGAPAEIIVSPGDTVKKGQLIARATKAVSSNVFSSVSGTVKGVVKRPAAGGGETDHIAVENDFTEQEIRLPALAERSRAAVRSRLRDAGVVGMGGAGFPTDVKILPPDGIETEILLINAAECEPYITCDYRVMLELTDDFLAGVEILREGCGAKQVWIAVEDNKTEAAEHLARRENIVWVNDRKRKATKEQLESSRLIKAVAVRTKYPQGAEKQLIYAALGRVVPEGKLPYAVGVNVNNVQTALAAYYAVSEGRPVCERVMTVSGRAAARPGNLWIKTGTTYRDVAEYCGVDSDKLAMIVSGGPMMGNTVCSEDVSVAKTTGSVLFLTEEEITRADPRPCIGCGRCVKYCPMNLVPVYIDSNAEQGDYAAAKKYGALACIACGCCSYVCPAKRPLVQNIRKAKNVILERKL